MAGDAGKPGSVEINRGKYPLFLLPRVVKDEIGHHKDNLRGFNIRRTGGHSFHVTTIVIPDGAEKDE